MFRGCVGFSNLESVACMVLSPEQEIHVSLLLGLFVELRERAPISNDRSSPVGTFEERQPQCRKVLSTANGSQKFWVVVIRNLELWYYIQETSFLLYAHANPKPGKSKLIEGL